MGPISCDRSDGFDGIDHDRSSGSYGIDFDDASKSLGTEPFGSSSMGQLRLGAQSVKFVDRIASADSAFSA